MRLEWSLLALADRDGIFDYIEVENPRTAVAVDDRIGTQAQQLRLFPESGRHGRIEGTRELVIQHTPYIAAYRLLDGTVRILRVLHGAQKWPDAMSDSLG